MTAPATSDTLLDIQELRKGRKVIVSAFRVSPDIANFDMRQENVYQTAPTLAQERQAYATSPEFRANVHSHIYRGEFLSDMVQFHDVGKPRSMRVPKGFIAVRHYPRADAVSEKEDVWHAEGDSSVILLPPNGWQVPVRGVLYNPETGFPLRTVSDRAHAVTELSKIMPREDAEREVSYFVRWDAGAVRLSPVSRLYSRPAEHGPFSVSADWRSPFASPPYVGSRVVRPMVERVYVLSDKDYQAMQRDLEVLSAGNIRVADVPIVSGRLLHTLGSTEFREEETKE